MSPHRTGDITTIGGNRLLRCFPSALWTGIRDTAYRILYFPQPTGDIFCKTVGDRFEEIKSVPKLVQMRPAVVPAAEQQCRGAHAAAFNAKFPANRLINAASTMVATGDELPVNRMRLR